MKRRNALAMPGATLTDRDLLGPPAASIAATAPIVAPPPMRVRHEEFPFFDRARLNSVAGARCIALAPDSLVDVANIWLGTVGDRKNMLRLAAGAPVVMPEGLDLDNFTMTPARGSLQSITFGSPDTTLTYLGTDEISRCAVDIYFGGVPATPFKRAPLDLSWFVNASNIRVPVYGRRLISVTITPQTGTVAISAYRDVDFAAEVADVIVAATAVPQNVAYSGAPYDFLNIVCTGEAYVGVWAGDE